jgi:Protein of unknown function (DUF2637)
MTPCISSPWTAGCGRPWPGCGRWSSTAPSWSLLTVLAAKRAATRAGYPWALAGLFSAASVAFNIAHAPDRPVAQLVFAMAPVALVLTTHLLMQQVGWRRATSDPTAPGPEQQARRRSRTPAQAGRRPRTRAATARIGQYSQTLVPEFGPPTRPKWRPGESRPGPA